MDNRTFSNCAHWLSVATWQKQLNFSRDLDYFLTIFSLTNTIFSFFFIICSCFLNHLRVVPFIWSTFAMGHKTAGRSFIWCQINGLNSWRTTENKRWRAPTKIWIDLVLIICKCDLCNVHTLGSEYEWEYFEKYFLVSLLMDWLLWLGLNSVTSESELFNQESEQTFWSNENSFYHSGNFLQAPWLVFQARIPQMLKWRKMLV